MLPYYKVHTPDNDLATTATAIRTQTYFLFKRHLPDVEEDFELCAKKFASLTGISAGRAGDIITALYRLKELPKLEALQESLFHLDFARLIAIDRVLNKLYLPDEEVLARIDDALTSYLTPRRAGQELPSIRNLRRKVNMLVAAEDPQLGVGESDEDVLWRRRKGIYDSYSLPGGMGAIEAQYDADTTAQLDAAISRTADEYGVSKSQALAMLILNDIERPTNVTLHVYQATDRPNSPVYVQDFGWVDPETGKRLAARATTTRDMSFAAQAKSDSYATPDLIKAYINGRDGHCRYPGCSRPASKCQKDHCVDFKKGGPTAAWNLVTCANTTTTSRPTSGQSTSSTRIPTMSCGCSPTAPGKPRSRKGRYHPTRATGCRPSSRQSSPGGATHMSGPKPITKRSKLAPTPTSGVNRRSRTGKSPRFGAAGSGLSARR